MVLIPLRVPKEQNVILGYFLSERFAIWLEPGRFLEMRRFSSVVVPGPRPRHALPFQEITPVFCSFGTLLGISYSPRGVE